MNIDRNMQIVTIGSAELLPTEVDSPTPESWRRALSHAEARARALALSMERELGTACVVAQEGAIGGTNPELVVRVTFTLAAKGEDMRVGDIDSATREPGILDSINEELRPIYSEFRQKVLGLSPRVSSRPAPLRNGKRRYEGFGVDGSRNVIVAGVRKREIILQFLLDKDHQQSPSEFRTRGRRDWLWVHLTSSHQIDGAVELARQTIARYTPEIA